MTAENEGETKETDGEGSSDGDESAEGEEGKKGKSGNSNSDEISNEPSDKSGYGSGAGVGTPDFDNVGESFEPRSMTDYNFRDREE